MEFVRYDFIDSNDLWAFASKMAFMYECINEHHRYVASRILNIVSGSDCFLVSVLSFFFHFDILFCFYLFLFVSYEFVRLEQILNGNVMMNFS